MNYYIQGNKEKADQIKAAFEKLGYNSKEFDFSCGFFFTHGREVHFCINNYCIDYIIKTHPDYKELELPKPHYDISNFHAGMPVLVRDYVDEEWCYVQFSHIRKLVHALVFNAGCNDWYQCIPFNDETKHLLGTTDMCDEVYINW